MTSYPPSHIGTIRFGAHQTWYRVNGDLAAAGAAPLVVAHGGPGAAHNYCLAMTRLAAAGRAVVLYDQLGCGNSTHLPGADPASWTVDLFVAELANLVAALGIADRFHLLGQSWGGMLAAEVMLRRPAGLRSVVLADTLAAMPLWRAETGRLGAALPGHHRAALDAAEVTGDYESDAFVAARDEFYRRHVCRLDPVPDEVAYTFAQIDADPTVYHAMNGPSEFTVTGSLRDWSVVGRLGGIPTPTLVVAGEHDEATRAVWQPFLDELADVRCHVFAGASHMPHVEQPTEFDSVVGDFLTAHD